MGKKDAKSGQGDFEKTCGSIISGVISVALVILTVVFPLIYRNSYFDILEVKYQCYYVTVIGMLAVSLVLALVLLFIDAKEYSCSHTRALFAKLALKNWKKTFGITDAAVFTFWLMTLISTLQSDYVFESFWGNEGRYSGLFLVTLYTAAYFMISKFWKFKGYIIELFLISGMILCVIGITDYFQLDVLDFRGEIRPEQSAMFTSTIGNVNSYTAYVALVMGVASAMFGAVRGTARTIWYYICMVITFFAIVMGCSDNAYLALGAMFAFLPFVLFQTRTGIMRYLVMVATFFTVVQSVGKLSVRYADIVIGFDGLFQVIVRMKILPYAVAAVWGAAAGVFLYNRKKRRQQKEPGRTNEEGWDRVGKLPVRIWGALVLTAVLAVCAVLYDVNAAGHAERYGVALRNYLEFGDRWGTSRGYIWRRSLELYQQLPLMHRIFGYGPDTFGIFTVNQIKFEMINTTTQIYDAAHNEYLQFLVTIGPIGMIAYILMMASAAARFAKKRVFTPYLSGIAAAVICYAAQAFVNLNLPIMTPMMWLLMSVGMAACRSKDQ